ncbi:pyruvate kinase-like [Spodoptera litura]|uniref:Pyruvate kinase n=1 Tax=Spodoptera litura TaxID=69820 RepID=A0A9J7EBA9_SPOLT|nr:pyruvate kinase-like [Spodoptera litura]
MVWPTEHDKRLGEYDAMELPGQQLAAANAFTPLDHVLNLDIKAPPACTRLTGIIASMGKSTYDVEVLEKMIAAGMNMAMLNMNFGPREEHTECIKMLRMAAKNYSIKMGKNYPLAIAMRLSGRKIRTGRIAETFGETVELKPGEVVRLTTDETYKDRCSTYTVYVDFMYFAEQMNKGDFVLLDNETIMLKVEMISTTTLTCRIERGGFLGSFKDVFVPNVVLNMPNYTEKDKLDIEMGIQNQIDIVIASFVSSASCIMELKALLGERGKKIAIIANIQTIEGFRNFDAILQETNGIMISRQELGSDITPKKLVIAQKNMIARANRVNVPIAVSAHILSSMRDKKIPNRAELLDIANCILDGVDSLVLCAETSVGTQPVETVAVMCSACKEAEACIWTKQVFYDFIDKTPLPCDQATGAAMAGVLAAQRSIAAAIVVVTTSGKSAQTVAKFKPRCPVIAVTRYALVARQLHMWRGIVPLIYEDEPETDWASDLEKRVNFAIKWSIERGFVRIGDPMVIISGWRQGTGFTNTMRVVYATADTVTVL